jgi:alanine dehydrogenase
VLLLSESDVRALFSPAMAISTIETLFKDTTDHVAPPRTRIETPKGVLRTMGAAISSTAVGVKLSSIFEGRPGSMSHVLLYEGETGQLLGIMQSDWLGQLRTGAATAVATKHMARSEWETLGIIGTGTQAETQLLVTSALKKPSLIKTYSRNREKLVAFCKRMQDTLETQVEPATSAQDAVKDADVVITATPSSQPVLKGEWLREGTHVNAMGSNFPHRRELDMTAIKRMSSIVVDDKEQAKLEAGELIHATDEGQLDWSHVMSLSDVVSGRLPGRRANGELTLFKSVGIALEDVAAAIQVYHLAVDQKCGQKVSF